MYVVHYILTYMLSINHICISGAMGLEIVNRRSINKENSTLNNVDQNLRESIVINSVLSLGWPFPI